MQYALQVFEFEKTREFRIVDIDGEPWFVLADACRALELKPNNGSFYRHAEKLDPDEKRLVPRAIIDKGTSTSEGEVGGTAIVAGGAMLMINESGLYTLILRSDKPEAKRFKRWVTSEVLPSIRKSGGYGARGTPAFVRRYNENWNRVSAGHFSVISELVIRLWGRLEQVGYVMADTAHNGTELRPDISVGRRFADWLRDKHPERSNNYSLYSHKTDDGEFEARQYPNEMWPLFIEFVDTVWLTTCATDYFKSRDPAALVHLPKLLPPQVIPRLARISK